jgi:soluble lytic murein transglycosylase-like protein
MNPFTVAFVLFIMYLFLNMKGNAAMYLNAKAPEVIRNVIDKWGTLARANALRYNLPPSVVLSIIAVESDGNPNASGPAGEKGLMQLTRIALQEVNNREGTAVSFDALTDPGTNIRVGSAYLARCLSVLKNMDLAIQGYNAGYPSVLHDSGRSVNYRVKVRLTEQEIQKVYSDTLFPPIV